MCPPPPGSPCLIAYSGTCPCSGCQPWSSRPQDALESLPVPHACKLMLWPCPAAKPRHAALADKPSPICAQTVLQAQALHSADVCSVPQAADIEGTRPPPCCAAHVYGTPWTFLDCSPTLSMTPRWRHRPCQAAMQRWCFPFPSANRLNLELCPVPCRLLMVMVRARPVLQALTWRLAPAAPPGSYPPPWTTQPVTACGATDPCLRQATVALRTPPGRVAPGWGAYSSPHLWRAEPAALLRSYAG